MTSLLKATFMATHSLCQGFSLGSPYVCASSAVSRHQWPFFKKLRFIGLEHIVPHSYQDIHRPPWPGSHLQSSHLFTPYQLPWTLTICIMFSCVLVLFTANNAYIALILFSLSLYFLQERGPKLLQEAFSKTHSQHTVLTWFKFRMTLRPSAIHLNPQLYFKIKNSKNHALLIFFISSMPNTWADHNAWDILVSQ